jgi:GAF domain-containing protein/two-component sensor histidine kinase
MAYEAAARFYLAGDNKHMAKLLLKRAVYCFGEWGASGKAASLRAEFPDSISAGGGETGFGDDRPAITGHSSEIDFSAFMKAVEAISTEIILDRLLERLIRIVIEYAGARRGVLMLNQDEGLFVRIEGALDSATAPPDQVEARAMSVPVAKADLPQGIIAFVDRTREPVRLENAAVKGRFTNDLYIQRTGMKSVLCVPLIKLDRISGVMYLENSLIEGAFPPPMLHLLKLLSGQAVISIENALVHELEMKHLQAKVNPHFIFNALSSIAELCNQNPQEAENAIVKLSILYRYLLTAEMRLVTIEEEVEIVRKYLAIEKLRFGGRLNFSVRVTGDPTMVRLPCLLIQPLVENCIKHGIAPRSSGGTIEIIIAIRGKKCTISVADDGVGLNTKRSGTGYGHASIKKRLALQYGSNYSFSVREANGYIVEMTIPV